MIPLPGRTLGRLLDRHHELDLVTEALDAAGAGSGRLLVVSGGLGSGRTALLRALPALAAPRGHRVLRASAAPQESDFAFAVACQLLEPLLAPGPFTGPDGTLPGAADDAEPYDELLALAADRSATRPLLLLVDDLHWADVPSLRLLARIVKRLDRLRITVVASVREGDPRTDDPLVQEITDRARHVLRPAPLSRRGTAALAEHVFGRPAEDAFTTACHTATGGNPLLLTALLEALAATGAPTAEHTDAAREIRLPALRERLGRALRAQAAPVQALAKALAVLDGHPDTELVGRLAGLDATGCAEALRTLRRLGLLAPQDPPRYLHRAVRDAVEDIMTPAETEDSRIHAALLLHSGGHPAEQAAAQLLDATSCQDGWATEVMRAAARSALGRGAHETAGRYLRRALLCSSPAGADRAALLVDLATVERDLDPPAAVRHISQAMLLIPDTTRRAMAAARIAPVLIGGCPPPTVEAVRELAEELGPPDRIAGEDRESALRLEARLRHPAMARPGLLASCAARLRALGPRPALHTAAERELVTVLLAGATLTQDVSAAEAVPLAERVLAHEPASPAHVHTALTLLVHVLSAADSVTTVEPWLRTAAERAHATGTPVPRAVIAVELTQVLLAQGRLTEARARAAEALDLGIADWTTLHSLMPLVMTAIESRDAELTGRLLACYREGAHHGVRPSPLQLLRGSTAAAAGDLPTALEYFLDWGRAAERAEWHNPALYPWRARAAGIHQRMGRTVQAERLMEEEYARAHQWGSAVAVGRAQRMKGALTEGEAGLALLRESLETLREAVNGMERARTSVLLGSRLRDAGRPEAEGHLRRGRQEALDCGAPWLAARAARELAAMDRGTAVTAVGSLTPAERRVASLAAHGVPNKDIAERLRVSSRAVEKHLTRSYRKLAITGRTELSGLAHLLPQSTTG
ncbi:AAA family ATPase [Streptomyces gamaensis]|uniref:AAA family ATPase n=1 Tax=Streptomyces gamaensis TaxID=1763542 RepID=A0ABW0Z4V1_9ACTN